MWYRRRRSQERSSRTVDDSLSLIKRQQVAIMIILDLASLLRLWGSPRWLSLGGAPLARTLSGARVLIRPSTLWLRIVLAFVAAAGAIIAHRPCGIATYFAASTDMPTNSGDGIKAHSEFERAQHKPEGDSPLTARNYDGRCLAPVSRGARLSVAARRIAFSGRRGTGARV